MLASLDVVPKKVSRLSLNTDESRLLEPNAYVKGIYLKEQNVPLDYNLQCERYRLAISASSNDLIINDNSENSLLFNHEISFYPTIELATTMKPDNQTKIVLNGNGAGGAMKRAIEDLDGETEDDLANYSLSRRSPPKKPKFVVTSEEMTNFFSLLSHQEIQDFLERDACCLITDKVFILFILSKKI